MKDYAMQRYFATFYYPGMTTETKEISGWNIHTAQAIAKMLALEYPNISPYGFNFYTMARGVGEWAPKRTATSPMYYLPHCKIETFEEIVARDDPKEEILRDNMQRNRWKRIAVVMVNTAPVAAAHINDDDIVLTQ